MSTDMSCAYHVEPKWYLVDAQGKTLGRLASELARRLRGKDKATFTPHVDTSDFYIVINAKGLKATGKKFQDKFYYRHSGQPGQLKQETLGFMLDRKPELALEIAVKGMLPKNPLGRKVFKKLKVYSGSEHPHQAQQPEPIDL
ncbi:MAG: 50S ribosomal protein L13 [Proteobacteria bacterium]|nr:50S ribosomal protein L13 [Pseudomonadota bacterium]